jgi:hypothetical protein
MLPKVDGHYWAKWKIKSPGTAEEHKSPLGNWEIVQVFLNCIDKDDPEHFAVQVAGVERSQSLENFFWGEGPIKCPYNK